MASTAEDFISRSRALRKEKRFEEALVASLAATNEDPTDPDGWWQTSLNRISLNDQKNSITSLRKTIEFAPHFSDAYARLAEVLQEQKADAGEIKKLLEKSVELECDLTSPYKRLASIYAAEKDKSQNKKEIHVLEKLRSMSEMIDFIRLGVLYWENNEIYPALSIWREGLTYKDIRELMFNLGLAYNHSQIGRPLDAIDIWRIARDRYEDYESVAKVLDPLVTKQCQTTRKAQELDTILLDRSQWYQGYLNPFSLLDFGSDFGNPDDLEHDHKEIVRLKKKLLSEVELEEGKLEWLHDYVIDKSRAISLCDELLDVEKWWRHLLVYSNKDLLDFLHRGSIEHFLAKKDDKAWVTLDSLRDDPEFTSWLSKYFVPQYDKLFGKLVASQDVQRLKYILSGRKWIDPTDEDLCFLSGRQAFSQAIKPLCELLEQAEKRKPESDGFKELLDRTGALRISDVLPHQMQDLQNELASTLRSIAIVCINAHGDLSLASEILELLQGMNLRSTVLESQIEEDIDTINDLLVEERKYEVTLYLNNVRWAIEKNGIMKGESIIGHDGVASVRWGVLLQNSSKNYIVSFKGISGTEISFEWTASDKSEKSDENFFNLVNAAICYIVPDIVERILTELKGGREVRIGELTLTNAGISMDVKGWFSSARKLIPWENVEEEVRAGQVRVWDKASPKASASLSLSEVPNAALIHFIVTEKKDQK